MAKINMNDFLEALDSLIAGLNASRDAAAPKLEAAVEKWARAVEKDARQNLGRPHWQLQRNITDKLKSYEDNKIWAMVGFKGDRSNPRDPGYYGKFHEAGWAPDRIVKIPRHFLRRAKQANRAQLERDIEAGLADVMKIVAEIAKKQRMAKKDAKEKET